MKYKVICANGHSRYVFKRELDLNKPIECRECSAIMTEPKSTVKNEHLDFDLLNRSSLLKVLELKRQSIFKIKCLVCEKESPGEIRSGVLVCSYCDSRNVDVVLTKPVMASQTKKSVHEVDAITAITSFKNLIRVQVALNAFIDSVSRLRLKKTEINEQFVAAANEAVVTLEKIISEAI